MAFCSSLIFCEMVMEHLEIISLQKLRSSIALNNNNNYFSNPPKELKSPVLYYKHFVDDVLVILHKDFFLKILSIFKIYNKNIQFTLEKENKNNNLINFLVISIFREENSYSYNNWYRKDTSSSRYLNYYSHHNNSQRIAIIYNIIDKCILLSDNRIHSQNINNAKQFLLANNYPIKFINKYIQKRIMHIKKNTNNAPIINNLNQNNTIVLPFYKLLNPTFIKT